LSKWKFLENRKEKPLFGEWHNRNFPLFSTLSADLNKIRKIAVHRTLLGDYEFHKNRRSESHNFAHGVNEFPSVLSPFIAQIG